MTKRLLDRNIGTSVFIFNQCKFVESYWFLNYVTAIHPKSSELDLEEAWITAANYSKTFQKAGPNILQY